MQALILDDELTSAESLLLLLQRYCPDIKVVALETTMTVALEKARSLQPPLLFLDVNLQASTGFDFFATTPLSLRRYFHYCLRTICFSCISN
jgi:two-component system LytT family response regulator